MEVAMKRSKNNIGKPAYDERKVKQSIKLAMSETPREEFELDLLQDLSRFEKWKKDNPGKRGPNDLEQRIEDLTNINKYHKKLNGELRVEVVFYKKKAEHYEIMSKQLKEDNKKLARQINDQIERIRKGI